MSNDVLVEQLDHQPPPKSTLEEPPSTSTSSKRKRKKRQSKPHILTQHTIRSPPWSYVHLQHVTAASLTGQTSHAQHADHLDAITAHQQLNAALRRFLGLHGAAIAFDILKLDGRDVWIRLATQDRSALIAAMGGWVSSGGDGWRVIGWNSWDAGASRLGRETGQDLFHD